MASAMTTRDQEQIRRWAEERGGVPTIVKGTGGLLRIDFVEGEQSGGREPSLEEIGWDEWFRIFDENGLTFLCSPEPDSKFFKIVSEETAAESDGPRRRRRQRRQGATQTRIARGNGRDRSPSQVPAERAPAIDREVSTAKRRMTSPKSALPLLRDQHRLVERIFQMFNRLRTKEERRACFEVLADHLAAHTEIEERFFYPAVKVKQTEPLLEHAVEEHLEAKQLISELLKREDADTREFSSKLKELQHAIQEHVREEESRLFPGVQALFTSEELDELGANMQGLFVQLIEMEPREEVPARASQAPSLE
jgi:hemerythrin-like domain-containing protein